VSFYLHTNCGGDACKCDGLLALEKLNADRRQRQQRGADLVRNAPNAKSAFLSFLGRIWFSRLIIITVVY
jgi:hypothetical protein